MISDVREDTTRKGQHKTIWATCTGPDYALAKLYAECVGNSRFWFPSLEHYRAFEERKSQIALHKDD